MRNPSTTRFFAGFIALGLAPVALGQCVFQSSLLNTFDAIGNPIDFEVQHENDGWTFRRVDGGRPLLVGITPPNWRAGAWGSPLLPFAVPCVGPRYSPNVARNQNDFYHTLPTFEGLMVHPNFAPMDTIVLVRPQTASTLRVFTIKAELLGTSSPNVVISAVLERAAGGTTTLVGPTSVLSLAAAVTLSPAGGVLPVNLAVGDRVVVQVNDGGNAAEDWLNVDVQTEWSGKPLVMRLPDAVRACQGSSPTIRVIDAGATTHHWRRNGVLMANGPTATGSVISGVTTAVLTIANASLADQASYSCDVGNLCGSFTTESGSLAICAADFNCDGATDFFDYDDFVIAFEAGDPSADFDRDGTSDFFDYDAFVVSFETGC